MKITPGNWRVTRDCCTSGNCVTCMSLRYGASTRVVQMDGLSKESAEQVAKNWSAYNPSIKEIAVKERV